MNDRLQGICGIILANSANSEKVNAGGRRS